MHAVLRVDLQARIVAAFVAHDLIHAGRAVALLGGVVEREVGGDRHIGIFQLQVAGLVFLVVGVGEEDRGEPVEGQYAVGFRVCLLYTSDAADE